MPSYQYIYSRVGVGKVVPPSRQILKDIYLSFFGRAWSEATLIKLAFAYEQATRHRRPPRFLPTVEV